MLLHLVLMTADLAGSAEDAWLLHIEDTECGELELTQ